MCILNWFWCRKGRRWCRNGGSESVRCQSNEVCSLGITWIRGNLANGHDAVRNAEKEIGTSVVVDLRIEEVEILDRDAVLD